MNTVVLLIGGNEGERLMFLQQAVEQIEKRVGEVLKKSSIYETEPWGFSAEQNFLNQALVVSTGKSPQETLKECLQIEENLGRQRLSEGYASRTMDIDILFFNEEIIQTTELEIPHPRLHQRLFVLLPLVEIMPDFIHPVLKKNISALLENCQDMLKVSKIKE